MILVTPNSLNAQIFALKLIICGGIVCFLPCLGRKAIFLPLNVPTVIVSDGFPYGVSISTSCEFSSNPES